MYNWGTATFLFGADIDYVENYGSFFVNNGCSFGNFTQLGGKIALGNQTLVQARKVVAVHRGEFDGLGQLNGTLNLFGGILSVGNGELGTFEVIGDLNLWSDATTIDIDFNGVSSDRIIVSGNALLQGYIRLRSLLESISAATFQILYYNSSQYNVAGFISTSALVTGNQGQDGVSVTIVSNAASSCSNCQNGRCIARETCSCYPGYFGKSCESFSCSWHCPFGVCNGPDICECDANYFGANCNIFLGNCSGIFYIILCTKKLQ